MAAPLFSLIDLVLPVTRTQVQSSVYDVLGNLGVDTTTWKPGAVVRAMITGASVVLSAFSVLQAQIARSGWLETAEGPWLTLSAWYAFHVDRIEATFASGFLTLTNTGALHYDLDPDDLIVKNPDTNAQYRNVEAVSLGAGASVTIIIRATETGAAGTSAPNTIVELVTTLLGVTCTNELAVVGQDEENDAELRTRCLEKLGSLSPFGPWDAYAYAARTATRPDGSYVGVRRVRSVKDGYGNVITYVATATGPVTGSITDPTSDLGIVNEAIQTKAEPLAVTAWVENAATLLVAVTYQAYMYSTSGQTAAQVVEDIGTRLAEWISIQPIGGNVIGSDPGKVFNDALRTCIAGTRPEIFHVVVSVPPGDLTVLPNQVPVLGTVTATVTMMPPPQQGGPS